MYYYKFKVILFQMHKVGLLFLVLLATSCQLFDKKVPDENQLLQQELQKINWEEVDELPSVMQCDTIKDIAVKKQCFFDYLSHRKITNSPSTSKFFIDFSIIGCKSKG